MGAPKATETPAAQAADKISRLLAATRELGFFSVFACTDLRCTQT